MGFGNRLIQVRKEHGYTRESLAQALGISKFTLRNYELEATEPGHTFLKQISDFFHVSVDYLMGLTDEKEILETFRLKSSEQAVIEKYRQLDDPGRSHVDTVLQWECDRVKKVDELSSHPAAIISMENRSGAAKRLVEYFRSVSAGSGVFILGNEIVDHIEIPATSENRNVDYAIKVSGDSMEPDYHDGDTVLVSQKLEMNYGDVGIFVINGSAYIKEYGKDELISRNPDFDNISVSEYDNIVCMGKVIGKLTD